MTNREFFEKVIATVDDAEIVDFAKTSIEKLDARNEKRKSMTSKKALENAPIKDAICDFLKDKGFTTCSEIEIGSASCRERV